MHNAHRIIKKKMDPHSEMLIILQIGRLYGSTLSYSYSGTKWISGMDIKILLQAAGSIYGKKLYDL